MSDAIDEANRQRHAINPLLMGLSNSVLAIKPSVETHPLRFNHAPTPIIDTVCCHHRTGHRDLQSQKAIRSF